MDGIYLKLKNERPDAGFDEKAKVTEMIRLIEEEGEKSKIVVCSKALKRIDANDNDFARMCKLYDEIEKEKGILEAISPRDYDTQAEFVAAIKAVTNHIPDAMWFDKLKEAYEVDNWPDLKALFPTEEAI